MMNWRRCLGCKLSFRPQHGLQTYCTTECQTRAGYQRRLEATRMRTEPERAKRLHTCVFCGHPIHGPECSQFDRWQEPCGCTTPFVRSATGGRRGVVA